MILLAQMVSFLINEPLTDEFYCKCFQLLVNTLKNKDAGMAHATPLAEFIDQNKSLMASLLDSL